MIQTNSFSYLLIAQEGSPQQEMREHTQPQIPASPFVSTGEGSPAVENMEEQLLGHQNHQKIEVIHRFANNHPIIFYGAAIIFMVILISLITLAVKKFRNSKI